MTDRIDVKILHYDYYNNKDGPVLICKCRDKNLNVHIVSIFDMENLAPRFGILKKEEGIVHRIEFLSQKEIRLEQGPPSLYKEETLRVYTQFPWQVGGKNGLRNEFSWTFQADVKWEKMAMSEIIRICGLESPYINIPSDYPYKYLKVEDIKNVPEERRFKVIERICYWDIEIDGRKATQFDGYKDANICPIISICCYDNYDESYRQFYWHPKFKESWRSYELKNYEIKQKKNTIIISKIIRHEAPNERAMLSDFFSHFSLAKYDDELGYWSEGGWKKVGKTRKWNNGFDSPFLYERTKFLGMLGDMQKMSPFGNVYSRNNGGKYELVIQGVGQIDWVFSDQVLQVAQKYYDFRGGRLADWMAFFTDFEKLDKRGKQPVYYWLNNLKFLLDYNLIDVWGLVELDKKFDMSGKQRGRCDVAISPLQDGIMASKLHDHAKLTIYQQDYAFDTKYYDPKYRRIPIKGKKQIGKKFTITLRDLEKAGKGEGQHYKSLFDIHKVGGFVKDIKPGVYEDVGVIDFSKYYPTMFKCTNAGILPLIDLEKEYWFSVKDSRGNIYDRKDIIETPVVFLRKDIQALNSRIFDLWTGKRLIAQAKLKNYIKKYRTTKTEEYLRLWVEQFNLKNFTNAYFGIIGLPSDRGYNKLAFNGCTMSCQDVIRMCLNKLINMGYKIIGGDTDSLFLKLKSKGHINQEIEGKWISNIINIAVEEYMERIYNINFLDNTIKIGLETISDKMYVDAKKHRIERNIYVDGEILDKPELKIVGMDLKKRSTSQVSADLQKKLTNCLFYSDDPITDMIEYCADLDKKLESMDWDYVCKRGPLQKRLDLYLDSNESATAAKNAIKYLGIDFKPGDNPFLGVFKDYPPKINGYFVDSVGDLKVSFYKEDIPKLKELGFVLNYNNIRNTQLHAKSKHILEIFHEDYDSLVESASMGDMMQP